MTKESSAANSSVEFSFLGPDVYWRAVRSPEGGKADVYIDGGFREAVECHRSAPVLCASICPRASPSRSVNSNFTISEASGSEDVFYKTESNSKNVLTIKRRVE
jgi:hypothetical protein